MTNDTYRRLLAFKIKQIRKQNNKTQEEFCSDIGIEVPNLSKIETGKSYPSIQTVINILLAYKVEPNDFFNFTEFLNGQNDEISYKINEYTKSLSKDLKLHLYEILKELNKK